MSEPRLVRDPDGYFRALPPRFQVLLCQLPLTLVMAAVAVVAPAFWPGLFDNALSRAALALHTGLLLACILVPWQRLGPYAALVIPVLGLVAIGLTRGGGVEGLPDLGVLAVLPVVWISGSRLPAPASLSLSFLGPLLAGLPWLFEPGSSLTPDRIATAVLVPLMMLGVSLALWLVRSRLWHERRGSEAREAELQALLADGTGRERLLSQILDTVDVGIVALDTDGRRLLTNSWQSQLEASAAPCASSSPVQEAELILTSHGQAAPLPLGRRPIQRAAAGETFADYLVCFGDTPGGRVVSAGGRPFTDGGGGSGGSVVQFNEVTGLIESLAAKDEVVSNFSHELRTPLTSIIGNLDLVLGDVDDLPGPAVRRIEIAQRNAERLLALVSDLLMPGRPAVSVSPRRTDLAALVDAALSSAQAHARSMQVLLSADVSAPLWAEADPLRIGQVLDNLVSNAIKYSPDGGIVRIYASTGDGWVRLHVEDTGMGMTAADASQVFTRFFRSPAVRANSIPGAGLGLSITKAIVEGHGGTISCNSRPGHGSTFTVALPADGTTPPR
ncbi:sensor histidine kinase [Arthrobacter sp. RHLT1-20]